MYMMALDPFETILAHSCMHMEHSMNIIQSILYKVKPQDLMFDVLRKITILLFCHST